MAEQTALEKLTVLEGNRAELGESDAVVVKGALFLDRYRIVEQFLVTSAEADVYKLEHTETGESFVLKLYRYGISPKSGVMDTLYALKHAGVVRLERYGLHRLGDIERFFEIQEFIAHGTLGEYAARKRISKEEARELLSRLNHTLAECHRMGIIHRDLKPANILLRSISPLEPVLTDFGIASVLAGDISRRLTSRSRTIHYGAPEALSGVLGREVDYWSLGIILMELLSGKHPFENINEAMINHYLTTRPMPIPDDLDEDWECLLKGLLTRDVQKRWGPEQVAAWLQGKHREIPVFFEGDWGTREPVAEAREGIKPYRFNDKEIYSLKELTEELVRDYDNALKHFMRGHIGQWIQDQLQDAQLKVEIDDLLENNEMSPPRKLSTFIFKANLAMPLSYTDKLFTEKNLYILLNSIIAGNETKENRGIFVELVQGGLYEAYLASTKRASTDEVKSLHERLWYGLKNICNKSHAPNMAAAYLFLLLVDEEARREALSQFHARLAGALSKVLEGLWQGSEKWAEPLTDHAIKILIFLECGQKRTEQILTELDRLPSLKTAKAKLVFLKDWVELAGESQAAEIEKLAEIWVDRLKSNLSDTLSEYVVKDAGQYHQLLTFLRDARGSWDNLPTGFDLKSSLVAPRVIDRNNLASELRSAYDCLAAIAAASVIDHPDNQAYLNLINPILQHYVQKALSDLDLRDLQWLDEANRVLRHSRPSTFISRTELQESLLRNMALLRTFVETQVSRDPTGDKYYQESKDILERVAHLDTDASRWTKEQEATALLSNDLDWHKKLSEIIANPGRFISKTSLLEDIKERSEFLSDFAVKFKPKNRDDATLRALITKSKTLGKQFSGYSMDNINNRPYSYYSDLFNVYNEVKKGLHNYTFVKRSETDTMNDKLNYIRMVAFIASLIVFLLVSFDVLGCGNYIRIFMSKEYDRNGKPVGIVGWVIGAILLIVCFIPYSTLLIKICNKFPFFEKLWDVFDKSDSSLVQFLGLMMTFGPGFALAWVIYSTFNASFILYGISLMIMCFYLSLSVLVIMFIRPNLHNFFNAIGFFKLE